VNYPFKSAFQGIAVSYKHHFLRISFLSTDRKPTVWSDQQNKIIIKHITNKNVL